MRTILTWALGLSLLGCGGGVPSREQAIREAASATCGYYDRCNALRTGGTYADWDHCMLHYQRYFDEEWPEEACGEGRIDEIGYELCLAETEVASCNFAGPLNIGAKCTERNVCVAPDDDD